MLRQGLTTALAGVVAGGVIGLAATRALGAGTAVFLLGVALAATYLPARRALRANRADVLRAEN